MNKYRIMTAIIIALSFMVTVWLTNRFEFAILSGIVMAMAAWEWGTLTNLKSKPACSIYTLIVLLAIFLAAHVISIIWLVCDVLLMMRLGFEIYCYAKGRPVFLLKHPLCQQVVGVLLITFCWIGLNTLYDSSKGHFWLFYAVALVCWVDIAGLWVGSLAGNHKLCVRVSPNKSWEGLLAGMVMMLPASFLGAFIMHLSWLNVLYLFLGSLLAALFALYGDLIESVMKREAQVKDSGHLLPGHGGVLDRLDSIIGGIPFMALFKILLAIISPEFL